MNMDDLSQNDLMLVQTEFPAELEKEAAAEAQLVHELYATGFSKLASDTVEMIEKAAEEGEGEGDDSDDDEGEDKEDYKEKMDEGEKKEAAARGAFIARGYIDGLMKEGQAVTGDPYFYVYDLLAEKVASHQDMTEQEKTAAMSALRRMKITAKRGLKDMASSAGEGVKALTDKAKAMGAKGKAMYQKEKMIAKNRMEAAMSGKAKGRKAPLTTGQRVSMGAKALRAPAAGVGGVGVLGGSAYAMSNKGS